MRWSSRYGFWGGVEGISGVLDLTGYYDRTDNVEGGLFNPIISIPASRTLDGAAGFGTTGGFFYLP